LFTVIVILILADKISLLRTAVRTCVYIYIYYYIIFGGRRFSQASGGGGDGVAENNG
jgi:hypothetical protein